MASHNCILPHHPHHHPVIHHTHSVLQIPLQCHLGSTTSLESTASDHQLHPCLPIRYNETFLKKLNGKPQVAVMNYLSIPLPPSDMDEEEDMDTA